MPFWVEIGLSHYFKNTNFSTADSFLEVENQSIEIFFFPSKIPFQINHFLTIRSLFLLLM